jgi:peroxiredoxin
MPLPPLRRSKRFLLSCALLWSTYALSDSEGYSQEPAASDTAAQQPGHSVHAHSFNEGPRQAAYLMSGMGNCRFPITTKNPMAQRFMDQGIAQLHGFWYFEAERSFRQAAAIDPDHPMPYWGMARANIENEERSRGFIELAMKRLEKASAKERRLIEAWNARVKPLASDTGADKDAPEKESKSERDNRLRKNEKRKQEQTDRLKAYADSLERLVEDFPTDIELKAMLVLQLWQNNGAGSPIQSHAAVDAMLSEIFRSNPRHPAHHFRIHLWDYRKEELALTAAAACGPSAPGIAHMWHMPGHTYSRLKRYSDAAWQQEASARVDHHHMMRDMVLPDQIHNYAHNNEWLIRSLNLIGRVEQATLLAKNMIELPRHPRYNMLGEKGSARFGRERLIQTLTNYQQWESLLAVCESNYLREADAQPLEIERLGLLAIASLYLSKEQSYRDALQGLTSLHGELEKDLQSQLEHSKPSDAPAKPGSDARRIPPQLDEPAAPSQDLFGDDNDPLLAKPMSKDWQAPKGEKLSKEAEEASRRLHDLRYRKQRAAFWLQAVEAHRHAHLGDYKKALRKSHEVRSIVPNLQRIEWLAKAGDTKGAWERASKLVRDNSNEFLSLSLAIEIGSMLPEKVEEVKELARKLIPIAQSADSNLPQRIRFLSIVEKLGLGEEWTKPAPIPTDIGDRPDLATLGPLRWSPSSAPTWYATSKDGNAISSKEVSGRPYVLILYLGFGCLHCAEQLAAFSPQVEAFEKQGIDVIGISTETLAELNAGIRQYDKEMHIRLHANPDLEVFRSFRAYDDFEGAPLHGTYLIDATGRVQWHDIGADPFMNVEFLLKESKRLLALPYPQPLSPKRGEGSK